MHICFLVTRGDSIGGAQIHVRDMALALHRDGHRVMVLTGVPGDMTSQLEAGGVEWKLVPSLVRPIRPVQDLKAVLATARILRQMKPDLLSCHTAKAGMVGRIAALLAGVPSIFTAHGWQFADGIPAGQARAVLGIERIVAHLCRRIITVSYYDYNLALRKNATRPEKMVIIHNGLPWRDSPSPNGTVRETEATCRLLMVARFQEQKDHETLLKALAGLSDLNWRLELVGDGPGMDTTREQAGELGIGDRIEFAGQRLDVPERMERADIYLLISNWEGFPRSIVEAMRASLPVIASDVGGCNESVAEGKTGFLVPRGDVGVLRERLSQLILNPEERRKMGNAGRARYEEEFTFRRMYERTLEVYREVPIKDRH